MTALGDGVLAHLRSVVDAPDLSGTKYRLLGRIGRGGMATVWEAEDVELGRRVAVKVASAGASEALEERMRDEARILARLEHPGIVPVHDVGVMADGRVFYVMKRVRGERLDMWLSAKPSLGAALRTFQRICEAVAYAHGAGVIHRDLKPENVMIGELGEALVLDWGIARAAGDDEHEREGAVVGTPAYMAPEQADPRRGEVDARTDVHGLGAILYFVLERRPPFASAKRASGAGPEPLDDRAPPALRAICARALAAAPGDRYPSAAELAADVGRFLDGAPVVAYRETLVERIARLASRHRVVLTLLATYVFVRVILALFVGG